MEFDMKSTFRAIRAALRRSKWCLQRPLILPGAKPKVRYVAVLDEVTVARECDYARIKYKER
jgi:hypothetical protein